MTIEDVGKEIIHLGAPLLGSIVGGPAGAAIGQIVASKFGGDINDPDNLIAKIRQDAESSLKLCEIQTAQQTDLQRLAVQQAETALKYNVENTEDARKKNVASKTIFPQILSAIVTIGFFGCIYWVAAYKQEGVDHDVLFTLLGGVGSGFSVVLNYWLGSSVEKGK